MAQPSRAGGDGLAPASRNLGESLEIVETYAIQARDASRLLRNQIFHPPFPSSERRQREALDWFRGRICWSLAELRGELEVHRGFATAVLESGRLEKRAVRELERLLEIDSRELPPQERACAAGTELSLADQTRLDLMLEETYALAPKVRAAWKRMIKRMN